MDAEVASAGAGLELVFGLPVLAVLAWFFHRLFHGVWLDETPAEPGPSLPPDEVGGAAVEGGEAWRIHASEVASPGATSVEAPPDPTGDGGAGSGLGPTA